MKLYREMEIDVNEDLQTGDRLSFGKLDLIVVNPPEDGKTWVMFDQIQFKHAMNENGRTKGGYLESNLRQYLLTEFLPTLSDELKELLVPDENGDLLTIPKKEWLVGQNSFLYFTDEKTRVATYEGETWFYWFQDVVSATAFALVHSDGGAGHGGASYPNIGCRPFALLI